MNWEAFTPGPALMGGALIGLATGLVLLLNGKIAGISGVLGRILRPAPNDVAWRVWFVLGLITSGGIAFALVPSARPPQLPIGLLEISASGFLVGLGTRLGGGCTSGHGVCGISRGSSTGLAATLAFMAAAMLTVFLRQHAAGAIG